MNSLQAYKLSVLNSLKSGRDKSLVINEDVSKKGNVIIASHRNDEIYVMSISKMGLTPSTFPSHDTIMKRGIKVYSEKHLSELAGLV